MIQESITEHITSTLNTAHTHNVSKLQSHLLPLCHPSTKSAQEEKNVLLSELTIRQKRNHQKGIYPDEELLG